MDSRSYRFYILLLSILLPLVYLLPVITSPLSSDDLHNFELRVSSKGNSNQNIFDLANGAITYYRDCGRYTPFAEYSKEFAFKVFKTILAYKIYLYFLNLLALAAFALLLYSAGQKRLIPFFLAMYGTVVQFRIQFHDPFTSLHGMYLWLGVCIFLSTALLIMYMQEQNYFLFALSLIFFGLSLLTSEVGLILLPVLFICSFFSNATKKSKILSAVPFLLCWLGYVIYVLHIRTSVKQIYEGVQTNFDTAAMLDVLAKQLFSTLPLSNLYQQVAIPEILIVQLKSPLNVGAILSIIFLSVGITALQIRNRKESDFKLSLPLIALGIALAILPACLIMQSVKYQQSLHYGFGYLPVFIQNFGTATLLACLFAFVISRSRKLILPVILMVSVCIVSASSFLFNKAISKTRAYEQSLPLQAQWESVQRGLLSSCESGSTIFLSHDYIYKAPFIYHDVFMNLTGKEFTVYDIEEWKIETADSGKSACYVFDCVKGDTIYTRLYALECSNGKWLKVLRTDTFQHNVRLADVEKLLLAHH